MARIYVAGPMTGIQDLNFPAFHAQAAQLRADGHQVVNPAELNPDPNAQWADCMKRDLEHHLARELGLHIEGAEL